ncbi:MAG: hypothetical protein IPL22_15460 [Bacteroidetes bacterium]|nr:hypothetical protein [Bacteroidota bacterium]
MQKFDELWIPDLKPPHNLSGKLSEIAEADLPHKHIGLLSRFTSLPKPIEKKYHFIALLSGVEPQTLPFLQLVMSIYSPFYIPKHG